MWGCCRGMEEELRVKQQKCTDRMCGKAGMRRSLRWVPAEVTEVSKERGDMVLGNVVYWPL